MYNKKNILAYKKAKSLCNVYLGKNWKTTFSKICIQGNHNKQVILEYSHVISYHQKGPRERSNLIRN